MPLFHMGTPHREIIIVELGLKNSVSEIHTAIHSNSKAVKYQNALAKQLAESKYSGTIAESKDLIDALFNVYKDIKENRLYKKS